MNKCDSLKEKKLYNSPNIEVLNFTIDDIICTSKTDDNNTFDDFQEEI